MMNDLISRQAAIDTLGEMPVREFKKNDNGLLDALISVGQVYMALKQLQSVQPEITRCKDCKHREAENGFCEGRGWPMQLVPDDGFCDKGERGEE